MCGVVGFLQPGGFSSREAGPIVSTMAGAIAHRGPDDAGVWMDSSIGIALAHRRLSVIDLSIAGHQPMQSQSGRYVISFNGEIYNHEELRRRLNREWPSAIVWNGRSDTEVLLATIDYLGIRRALENLVGMFAFALWDRQERRLFLARDRMGEKPLYFGWQNGVFMFGSELKALRAHPSFDGEIDKAATVLFLRYSYIPAPWSIYKGIQKLLPGTYFSLPVSTGGYGLHNIPEPTSYWSLNDVIQDGRERPFEGDSAEAVDALHRILRQAVDSQITADVPLGALLSGGIDSSTIVALMQACSSRAVRTFTIGFEDRRYDEALHAKNIADHLGTDHTQLYASPRDAIDIIPRLPVLYDEPFADASQIPTIMVSAITREQVTVALTGDGGDELFGGYQRYFRTRTLWSVLSHVPKHVLLLYRNAIAAVPPDWWRTSWVFDKARMLAEIQDMSTADQLYQGLISHWKAPSTVVRGASEPQTLLSDPQRWPAAPDFESRMMAIDALTYLPDDILVKVDRAAMGVSLETRLPFLDHRVVEFAWRLPLSLKIRRAQGKWILRQVLQKYVPVTLFDRPKMGFALPLAAWLRGPLRDWAESLLNERRLRAEGFFRPGPITDCWREHVSGRRNWGNCLWDVLMFQAWLDSTRKVLPQYHSGSIFE